MAAMGWSRGPISLRGWACAKFQQPPLACPVLLRAEHHVGVTGPLDVLIQGSKKRVNLAKEMQDLYTENYKIMLKKKRVRK